MEPTRRLAAVIVNYRTPELACGAARSLVGEIDPAQDAAIVVDNASGDGSSERIEEELAKGGCRGLVRVVRARANGGFAAGSNLGIRSVDARFYLLLNSDAQLRPGALDALFAAAAARPEVGLLGPRLEGADGALQTSCFRYHSPASEMIHAAATSWVTRALARWDVPLPPGPGLAEPEWISFACVLIRREVIETAGLLDEGYFLYLEDVDYCRRARALGWRIAYVPEARALHLHGGSSGLPTALASRARAPAYLYDSRARYFTKYYGRGGLWLANGLWTLARLVSLARELLGSKAPHVCEGEWADIWRGSPGPLR